ncbi:MAG: efflux transporter outer membrane subunit [Methylovulum sp.]|nr:efflux transporter outer membrane subunit [Methylovulum sp.]
MRLPPYHVAPYILLAVLLPGCTATPGHAIDDVGIPAPSRWLTENTGQPPLAQWLLAFADPALSALVQEALSGNYDLKAAAARVHAAQEQALIQDSARWPQLALTPSLSRMKDFATPASGAFSALFNLSWEIDLWGRIRAAQQATQQDADAAQADFYGARLSLAAHIAQGYFDLAEARQQVDVVQQSVNDRQTIVELVHGRFARGLTKGLDLRLVLTDLANAKSQLANANNQVQAISRQLEVLSGRYPQGRLTATSALPPPPATLRAGLPSELLTRRPDLIAAFSRLQAADARVKSAQLALLPRLTLTADGGTSSPALAAITDPRSAAWNLGLGLVQPLLAGGRLKAEIRLNEARTDEALNQYRSVALNAFREVEQALAAETWLRSQEQALQEAVVQTHASRELAVYSYRQGLIEILTLLDSYRSTLNAQSAHLAVRRQLLNTRINLYLALGGGLDETR